MVKDQIEVALTALSLAPWKSLLEDTNFIKAADSGLYRTFAFEPSFNFKLGISSC